MRCLLFFALSIFAHFHWANAAVVDDLYNASVLVTDQSASGQKKAVKQALAEVLVKVSGNRAILADADIKSYINSAENILLSYAYESTPAGLLYKAEFDVNKVEGAIRSTGFSIWGKHRPQTLIWLAIEEQGTSQRKLLSDSIDGELIQAAFKASKQRGISIGFPVMDLTDIQRVSVYDVWSSFTQNLVQASDRYGMEYVMSGQLYYRDKQPYEAPLLSKEIEKAPPKQLNVWVLEWMITRQGVFNSGEAEGETRELAMENAINMIADAQADKYAITATSGDAGENKTQIVIGNISSLTAYIDVLDFLKNLSVVIDVSLVEQQGDFATFELQLFGAKENLDEAFKLDDRLQRGSDNFGQSAPNNPYIWRP